MLMFRRTHFVVLIIALVSQRLASVRQISVGENLRRKMFMEESILTETDDVDFQRAFGAPEVVDPAKVQANLQQGWDAFSSKGKTMQTLEIRTLASLLLGIRPASLHNVASTTSKRRCRFPKCQISQRIDSQWFAKMTHATKAYLTLNPVLAEDDYLTEDYEGVLYVIAMLEKANPSKNPARFADLYSGSWQLSAAPFTRSGAKFLREGLSYVDITWDGNLSLRASILLEDNTSASVNVTGKFTKAKGFHGVKNNKLFEAKINRKMKWDSENVMDLSIEQILLTVEESNVVPNIDVLIEAAASSIGLQFERADGGLKWMAISPPTMRFTQTYLDADTHILMAEFPHRLPFVLHRIGEDGYEYVNRFWNEREAAGLGPLP